MRENIEHFFEKKQFYAWDSSISNRSMAWEAWIESKMTFFDALWLMLPAWLCSRSLRARFAEYKQTSAKRLCLFYLENDGSLYLSGKRFIVPGGDYSGLLGVMRDALANAKKNKKRDAFDAEGLRSIRERARLIPFH